MSRRSPKRRHRRKSKPPDAPATCKESPQVQVARTPCNQEEGLRRLELALLVDLDSVVESTVKAYRSFLQKLLAMTQQLAWADGGKQGDVAMPFNDVCRDLGRSPAEVRQVEHEKIPRGLLSLARPHTKGTCPFCHSRRPAKKRGGN